MPSISLIPTRLLRAVAALVILAGLPYGRCYPESRWKLEVLVEVVISCRLAPEQLSLRLVLVALVRSLR